MFISEHSPMAIIAIVIANIFASHFHLTSHIQDIFGQLNFSDGAEEIRDFDLIRISFEQIGSFSDCRNAQMFRTNSKKFA